MLAYVFGRRKNEVFEQLNEFFASFDIKRLARKTIWLLKLEKMHDIVIGLLINKLEF